MRCPGCQRENEANAKLCEECGTPLARTCGNCGHQLPPAAKFCPECAHPTELAADDPESWSSTSPGTYTPQHAAERILRSKVTLEGERKQVTVLFADLKGSMELVADRDPEEARKILDPVLERMMEAVHRYDGTVNQVMGDGIMALFGAPLAYEDHAIRACYAALRMQESVKRYSEDMRHTAGIQVSIRVGLNSGEVVVRSIGSDLQMDYTAVGQSTHLAARMEQAALPGSILLTADTLRLAEGYIEVTPLGLVPVKGRVEPVEVYELIGAGAARRRFETVAVRGLSRFVGREAEYLQLGRALDQARKGQGQVVAIVGEPGVGKSRLFWEFTHSDRLHGWLIAQSGSVSYGMTTAFLPVIDLLKGYFQIEARDEPQKIREKVTGKLLALDHMLEPTLPAFFELLNIQVENLQWEALAPSQRRQQMLDAVKQLVIRESEIQPLLIVFEDLHWIDSETRSVLDTLVESLPSARVLLLVNYRPEWPYPWGSKPYSAQLRIDPLPPESAEALLHAELGADISLTPLKRRLIEQTEGNPLFLEECVRTLVETKRLMGNRGDYRLAQPIENLQMPATVHAVLASRIDRLGAELKQLLQTAAVIGKEFPFSLLRAVTDLPEDQLRHGLAQLQRGEFVYEAAHYPDWVFTFKHALTHEVAYTSLLHDRRAALHGKVVDAIEQLYEGRLTEQVERLARHAWRGRLWAKAARYFRAAGTKAADRSAYHEAIDCIQQALAALAQVPATRETIGEAIDLRLELRNALWSLGEIEQMARCLNDAQALAETLGDALRLGQVMAQRSQQLYVTGQHDRAVEWGGRALAIATELGDLALEVTVGFYLGVTHYHRGEYRLACDYCLRNLERLVGAQPRERCGLQGVATVVSRGILAISLAELGKFTEGSAYGEEAIHLAEAAEHPYSIAVAHYFLGALALRQGDLEKAVSLLERGLELWRLTNIVFLLPQTEAALGCAYVLLGRSADAEKLLVGARGRTAGTSGLVFHAQVHLWVGEARLRAGLSDAALECATRALEIAREYRERGHEGWALWLIGDIVSHQEHPDVEKARRHFLEALGLADELGMHPLKGQCNLGLGRLYLWTKKRERARECLMTARTMFREMDIRHWSEQAEEELRRVAIC